MQPFKTVSPTDPLTPVQPAAPGLEPNTAHGGRPSRASRDPLFPNDTADEIVPEASPKAKRSIAKWATVLVLAAVVAIVFLAMNQRSVGNGNSGGAVKDSSPNTPTDFRPR
ncbi:MAG TPA: hypothetical protein VHM25_02930 [Polyangiaceae bacterium]|nr:hypothetical protein [Polyangiaceae bacterium]